VDDDRLRTDLHLLPSRADANAQIALTLREVCGLTTRDRPRLLYISLTVAPAHRRAKAKIRDAGIPYQVAGPRRLAERLDSVLHVVYLVFNEATSLRPANR